MTVAKDPKLKLVKQQDRAGHPTTTVLTDIFKALKALGFYPDRHPLRTETLGHAHASALALLAGSELTLQVSRNGIASANGEPLLGANPMVQALAKEFFIRRIQRLTFLPDLELEDLSTFLKLVNLDPQRIVSASGMESLMTKYGIRTIWLNEVDISTIWEKRHALEASSTGPEVENLDEAIAHEGEGAAGEILPPDYEQAYSVEELLELMANETDDNRYLQLARGLLARTEIMKTNKEFTLLIPVMTTLLPQITSPLKSAIQREYASFALEQMASGPMADFLLSHIEQREHTEKSLTYDILRQLGTKFAYVIIQRLCVASSLLARKALAVALVHIGPAAVPPLVSMLKDDRWYVVRNMVAILGEISSPESVANLRETAYHDDPRVRKESIRSLIKIGGKEAEVVIIGLLEDRDQAIVRQAILSLGVMRSQLSVQPLIEIVGARDLLLQNLTLKKEALQALGRIGDRRATPHLLSLLQKSHWIAWNRWEELKIAAAAALGQIGDESALPFLKARAAGGGSLGRACSDAVDNIERIAG